MKKIYLSFCLLLLVGSAYTQTLFDVSVSSNVFTPANLNIVAGDTVRWTNVSGFHNVNGTTATYPSNPASFGNAVASSPWVFTHVFTLAGTYDYQCDVHIGNNMVGTITVSAVSTGPEIDSELALTKAYPNPAADFVTLEIYKTAFSDYKNLLLIIYDNVGKELYRTDEVTENMQINLKTINSGTLHYTLLGNNQIIDSNKIIVR